MESSFMALNQNQNQNGLMLNYNSQGANMINMQNSSGIPKKLKITSWILFFISIIFSILLI